MGRRVEDKEQRLASASRPELGPLRADRDLLRRMVENLIDNAYKYSPRRATIAIEALVATMDDGAEPAVEIRVRDEGEGIPVAYRQRIFEKYRRVDDGRGGGRTATASGWCSAGGRSGCTAGPSGSTTAAGGELLLRPAPARAVAAGGVGRASPRGVALG